ncbi:MAG: biotin--[acetyl-CoA-carboxylase] ligase [Campylobacterota bacterium]
MEIRWFESLGSTQTYLVEELKAGRAVAPVCVGASFQSEGKGSRGNPWIGAEGNLFLSLAFPRALLPADLRIESVSIYMAFLMKELLARMGSGVWLKWPNDFYLEHRKIGGVVTNLAGEDIVCGIGINLVSAPEGFGTADITVLPYNLTKMYCEMFENLPSWKQIFSKYQLEFEHSREFFTHHEKGRIALDEAVLLDDGSLMCKGQRIFSLR